MMSDEFLSAIREAVARGHTHIDVIGLVERPAEHLEALAESGLVVRCVTIGLGLPPGETLDAVDIRLRRSALDKMKRQIADAALLGASSCRLIPSMERSSEAMVLLAAASEVLAEYAARRMLSFTVSLE